MDDSKKLLSIQMLLLLIFNNNNSTKTVFRNVALLFDATKTIILVFSLRRRSIVYIHRCKHRRI